MKRALFSLLNFISGLFGIFIVIILILEFGFHLKLQEQPGLFHTIYSYLFIYFAIDFCFRFLFDGHIKYILKRPTDIAIFLPVSWLLFNIHPLVSDVYFSQICLLAIMLGRLIHINLIFKLFKLKPAQMVLIGFIFAIFIGSLVLSLPIATASDSFSYVNALFTATSAVCVTGLIVVDTGTTFTTFGQTIILILIQIGGLGIMTLSVLVALLLNRRISQKETMAAQESYATYNMEETFRMIRSIVKFTFLFEAVGSLLLFGFWRHDFSSTSESLFISIFHSVSAFCNAGFSLFSDSLMHYSSNTPVILTISGLIILGGIGFPVIFNIYNRMATRKKFVPIRLNTKIVLIVTFLLLLIGTAFIFIGEYSHSLANMPLKEKLLVSFFHSVSARTCGFNSIDLSSFHPATLLTIILLMFIGASPGSTGGGIKTTTFGIMAMVTWNTFKSKETHILFGRTISKHDIFKVISIALLSLIIVLSFVYLVLMVESQSFMDVLFETFSAFGTVGLSLGITHHLSLIGKSLIMILMFIGRVGALTIAIALSKQKSQPNVSYPEENVLLA